MPRLSELLGKAPSEGSLRWLREQASAGIEADGPRHPDLLSVMGLSTGTQRRRESIGSRQRTWAASAAQETVRQPLRVADRRRQLAGGVIKPFVRPDAGHECCARQCTDICFVNMDIVNAARASVFACGRDPEARRIAVRLALRLFPPLPNGLPMCVLAQRSLWSCSRTFIYPDLKAGAVRKPRASEKQISVLAWFQLLLESLDRMPDESFYQVAAPDKKSVHSWYMADHALYPKVYPAVTTNYFLKIWRHNVGALIRLRRYSRFTKCEVCLSLKREKTQHGRNRRLPESIFQRLTAHYRLIRRYRARAMRNAIRGSLQPQYFLSISMDGTEQLGYGYPKSSEHTSDQDNFRLKTKVCACIYRVRCVCVCVLGRWVICFCSIRS